jgi:hypothetical protein
LLSRCSDSDSDSDDEVRPALMGRGWLPSNSKSESDADLPPLLMRRGMCFHCDSESESDSETDDELPPLLLSRRDVCMDTVAETLTARVRMSFHLCW